MAMNDDLQDAMQGQIAAINMVLIQLMTRLPALAAAEAAVALAIEQDCSNQEDSSNETPPRESAARNAILDGYLALLQSVASHG